MDEFSSLDMRVIYLHGFASSPASRKARFFGEKFTAAGVEFTAPALDEGDFRNLRISKQLRLVEALLTAPGQDRDQAVLMGSSLGGYLAAILAARHPKVSRLLLLAPAFNLYDRWTSDLGSAKLAAWKQTGEAPVFHYGMGRETAIGYQFIEEAAQYDPFPNFQQDAVIFHGSQDPVVPIEFSEAFVSSHPGAKLIRLAAGHELTDVMDGIWIETIKFLQIRDGFPKTGIVSDG